MACKRGREVCAQALERVSAAAGCNLRLRLSVCAQAPLGKAIPASLIQLLKATRSALLVYKSNDAF